MNPLTLDQLLEEVRQGRTPPFDAWSKARAYERSLFPPDTHWPREGDIYECAAEHDVRFVTHWSTAFTGGGIGRLLPGERIQIRDLLEERPVIVSAVPLDNMSVQARIISEHDRQHPSFVGYSLSLRTRDLLSHFRLLP